MNMITILAYAIMIGIPLVIILFCLLIRNYDPNGSSSRDINGYKK
jgi:hypothetical protein